MQFRLRWRVMIVSVSSLLVGVGCSPPGTVASGDASTGSGVEAGASGELGEGADDPGLDPSADGAADDKANPGEPACPRSNGTICTRDDRVFQIKWDRQKCNSATPCPALIWYTGEGTMSWVSYKNTTDQLAREGVIIALLKKTSMSCGPVKSAVASARAALKGMSKIVRLVGIGGHSWLADCALLSCTEYDFLAFASGHASRGSASCNLPGMYIWGGVTDFMRVGFGIFTGGIGVTYGKHPAGSCAAKFEDLRCDHFSLVYGGAWVSALASFARNLCSSADFSAWSRNQPSLESRGCQNVADQIPACKASW